MRFFRRPEGDMKEGDSKLVIKDASRAEGGLSLD